MKTKVIEVTNGFNYGKFLVGRFDEEWFLESKLPVDPEIELPGRRSLIGQLGWHTDHTWVLDLQTGEGAFFWPVGSAHHDLIKHKVWVCPMFEPFLTWVYTQNLDDIHALPDVVEFTEEQAPSALYGYRRGVEYVNEGWWNPNVKDGRVHDHPERPGRNWSAPMHRLCEPVFTQREAK